MLTRVGMKTFVQIPGAQYLGPAIVPGAVYIGSTTLDQSAEVICIRGNQPQEAGPVIRQGVTRHAIGGASDCGESGFVSATTPLTQRKSSTNNSAAMVER